MAEEEKAAQIELSSVFEAGKPVYYSNQISTTTTLHDVRMSFGKLSPLKQAIYDVHVYLPMTAAKQLRDVLIRAIDQYENDFGPIQLEPKKKSSDD